MTAADRLADLVRWWPTAGHRLRARARGRACSSRSTGRPRHEHPRRAPPAAARAAPRPRRDHARGRGHLPALRHRQRVPGARRGDPRPAGTRAGVRRRRRGGRRARDLPAADGRGPRRRPAAWPTTTPYAVLAERTHVRRVAAAAARLRGHRPARRRLGRGRPGRRRHRRRRLRGLRRPPWLPSVDPAEFVARDLDRFVDRLLRDVARPRDRLRLDRGDDPRPAHRAGAGATWSSIDPRATARSLTAVSS